MSKKVFGTILKVVGVVALTVVTYGAATGTLGVWAAGTAATATAAATAAGFTTLGTALIAGSMLALNIGGGLLAADKAAKAARSARAEQIRAMVNPQAEANWVFGETATAVQIVYTEVMGSKKDTAAMVYAGPAHPVHSYGQLYINDDTVNFSGANATGIWAGALSRYTNLGAESQLALVIPGSTWPSTARGRGFAHFGFKWFLDKDKLKDGIPDRITQVVKGAPVYDPRLDSSVGGSGTQRADDQTTWAYVNANGDVGANWALVVLHYILGWRNNGILVYGRGADPQDIDYASFISAANACDALVDGKPRYHIGGIERIDGDHARVISSLEATIGGKVSKVAGIYHCWAPFDDLVPVATIAENDLVRGVGYSFNPARPLESLYNTAEGQYINPDILYQPDAYPRVQEASALADHGRERIMSYDMTFIQDSDRAQRIALQQIRRSIFGRMWQYPVGPKYFDVNVFDVVTLNTKQTNYQDVVARITNRDLSPNGMIIYTLEEENSLIYDVTATLGTKAQRQIPPTFDSTEALPVTNLDVIAVSVVGNAGTASDALQVSYDDPGPLVSRTDIEFQVQGATEWQPAASKRLDAGVAIISPVESGTIYYVRVRHITVFEVSSAWVTDFTTAGESTATPYTNITGGPPAGATPGNALNVGAAMNDLTKWFDISDAVLQPEWTVEVLTDGVVGAACLQVVDNNNDNQFLFSEEIPVDQSIAYKMSVWCRQLSGDRKNYLMVSFYDENGVSITNASTPVSDASGWDLIGGNHYWGVVFDVFPATFTKYELIFGGSEPRTIPSNAVSMRIGGLFSRDGITSTTIQIQDYRVQQAIGVWDEITGTAKPDDYAGVGGLTPQGGSLIVNSNMTIVAADGRPAGVKAVYGSIDQTNISYQDAGKTILKLYSATDSSINAGFPAFSVSQGQRYKVFCRAKASIAAATGFYIEMYEKDSELAEGITHIAPVSSGTPQGVVVHDRQASSVVSNAALTTDWIDFSFEYKPTATAKWCSPVIANWTGLGLAEVHIDRLTVYPYVASVTDLDYTGDLNATANTGALANLNTVSTGDIVDGAVNDRTHDSFTTVIVGPSSSVTLEAISHTVEDVNRVWGEVYFNAYHNAGPGTIELQVYITPTPGASGVIGFFDLKPAERSFYYRAKMHDVLGDMGPTFNLVAVNNHATASFTIFGEFTILEYRR